MEKYTDNEIMKITSNSGRYRPMYHKSSYSLSIWKDIMTKI